MEHISEQMSAEKIQGIHAELAHEELADEEPLEIDEWTLEKLAETAELEDQIRRSKAAIREIQAASEARDRAAADARFDEARRLHPNLTVHQVMDLLDDNHL